MTPHDFHPCLSSNMALLAAAVVMVTRKIMVQYAARWLGAVERRRYVIVGSAGNSSLWRHGLTLMVEVLLVTGFDDSL